ncbi:MAG: apolipoprotein N-acyltransferase [Crocinitomicaceae bacterium]
MKLRKVQLLILAIVGGILLSVSFPFIGGLFPLAFIALVPLLVINFELDKKPNRRFIYRFSFIYLYFVIYNASTCWWIYYASESGMYMAIFANALLMTLPFFLTGFINRKLGENKALLSFLVLWLCFEHLHYYWELSWPWLNFGHILGTYPKLIQWYAYSGVAGGTFWILLVNIMIYVIVRNIWLKNESVKIQTPNFIFTALAIIIPVVSSLLIYHRYEEKEDPVNIVIVQPNIEANTEKFVLPRSYQLEKMFSVAAPEIDENTDLLIFPETAIPYGMDEKNLEEEQSILDIREFMAANFEVPVLTGADTYQLFSVKNSVASRKWKNFWWENYNTAIMMKYGMPLDVYHKSKLVLGGEKLPFVSYFPFLAEYSVELGGTSGLLGTGEVPEVFMAKGVGYAPLICYESVYGDYTSRFVRKGAEVICVITNDGWWQDTPGYKQHRMFSQIRAIENRRSVARSANTGISCVINQRGDVVSELGWNEYGAIKATINRNQEYTFFTRYESIIGRLACFLSIAMLLYGFSTAAQKSKWYPSALRRK